MFLFLKLSFCSVYLNDFDSMRIYTSRLISQFTQNQVYESTSLHHCIHLSNLVAAPKTKSIADIFTSKTYHQTHYSLEFDINHYKSEICNTSFIDSDVDKYIKFIEGNYYQEYDIEDYPFWVKLGYCEEKHCYIYTHLEFNCYEYNNFLINCNATESEPRKLKTGPIHFTYNVTWASSYVHTPNPYPNSSIFNVSRQIKLFFFLFVILTVSAILIIIYMKKFFRRDRKPKRADEIFENEDDGFTARALQEATSPPEKSDILAAFAGFGIHIFLSSFIFFYMSTNDSFYSNGIPLFITYIATYVATAPIAGFCDAAVSALFDSRDWKFLSALQVSIGFVICFTVVTFYLAPTLITKIISTETLLTFPILLEITLVFCTPLTMAGHYLCHIIRPFSLIQNPPRRKIPRIEVIPIYANKFLVGSLYFLLLFVMFKPDFYMICFAFSEHQFYDAFKFLFVFLLTFTLLAFFFGIAYTSFMLRCSIYRWHWKVCVASVLPGFFFFFYLFVEIIKRGESVLMKIHYLSYALFICSSLMLLGSGISYISSNLFINLIFSSGKTE